MIDRSKVFGRRIIIYYYVLSFEIQADIFTSPESI